MNDGTISANPTPVPQQNAATQNVTVKVENLPGDIPVNKIISGEVVSSEKGQISVKTEQGVVVLNTQIDMAVGQKVNLKIQQMMQQSVPIPIAELINMPVDKTPVRPTESPPVINPVIQDPIVVHDPSPFEEYKPLQALVTQMPDILTDETVNVLLKTVLSLPASKPLPPGLQEGLSKLSQLTNLLSQANLLQGNQMKPPEQTGGLQQNIISVVQNLFQNFKSPVANPLLNQNPQPFIQLQFIQPGQTLSPNILVDMKQQLMNVLQKPLQAPMQTQPEQPSGLSALIGKAGTILQSIIPGTQPQPITAIPVDQSGIKPNFTTPMIGLVLGNAAQSVPQLNNPVLVFMQMPGNISGEVGRQFIGFLSPPMNEGQPAQNLLPGSVIVTAVPPQAQKEMQFTILPQQILPEVIETFMPINPGLGESWPVLDEIWDQAMAQQTTHPEVLASLRQIIPAPMAQQMPPAMMFFLSVLKNGFSSDWIPEKHLAVLEGIDKEALINTLNRDLSTIRARLEDPLPVDAWRPLPIPMQLGDQLMRLQWFYRHPENEYEPSEQQEENTPKKRKTRFLLNVPKTGLGDIQIDGLVQEQKLDLILRTEQTLMSHMETTIRGRYASVLETTGMVGGIDFQSGRHHYVHV